MLAVHTLALFGVGGIATAKAVTTSDDGTAIVAGLLGLFSDALLAYGLFNVEVVTDSGVVSAGSYPPLALFALAGAIVAGIVALTGPLELLADEASGEYGIMEDTR